MGRRDNSWKTPHPNYYTVEIENKGLNNRNTLDIKRRKKEPMKSIDNNINPNNTTSINPDHVPKLYFKFQLTFPEIKEGDI